MQLKMLTSGILYLILIFLADHKLSYAKELYWEKYNVILSGVSDNQLAIIEDSINQLKGIKSNELRINLTFYKRLSRFDKLFGSIFNGEELFHWLLSRIRKISYHNSWTVAINQNRGQFILGDSFFNKLNVLERLYLLIHEARHSDDGGYAHVKCPKGFRFVSAMQPDMNLENELACDDGEIGAYAFQAAFLFELFAYDIFDQREVGLLYNSSISRVIPEGKRLR